MGRAANALDWTEEGSGVGLRALRAPEMRPDSELRFRELPFTADELGEGASVASASLVADEDDDEPATCRSIASAPVNHRDATEALSARGVARLSALADWIEGEDPRGAVVPLVRAFLRDVQEVGITASVLTAAASDAPELTTSVYALVQALGLWRTNLLEHVDELALSNYRSLSGWASLPEYSAAYTLALITPALVEAEAWAIVATTTKPARSSVVALLHAIGTTVARLNATLRTAILGAPAHEDPPRLPIALLATAW